MATEDVNAQAGTETQVSPAPSPETTPQVAPAPTVAQPSPSLDTIDPQERERLIEQYITAKSHEDLAKIPGYNKAIQRKLSRLETEQRVRLQQEGQQQAQRSMQMQQNDNYFRGLDGTQLYEVLQNPQTKAAFDEVQQWKRSGTAQTFDEKSYLTNAVKRFKETLSENEDFADVDWEKVESKADLGESLTTLAEHATGKRRKQLETDFNKLRKDLKAEIMADIAKVSDQPDAGTGGAPGAPGDFTWAQIQKMSQAEWKTKAAQIDQAIKEGRVK